MKHCLILVVSQIGFAFKWCCSCPLIHHSGSANQKEYFDWISERRILEDSLDDNENKSCQFTDLFYPCIFIRTRRRNMTLRNMCMT